MAFHPFSEGSKAEQQYQREHAHQDLSASRAEMALESGEIRRRMQRHVTHILYGARVGDGASLGPLPLVLKGEDIPPGTRSWIGSPAEPWAS